MEGYIKASYTQLKNYLNTTNSNFNYLESDTAYDIFLIDGNFKLNCLLRKSNPANVNQTDFEINYKNKANKKVDIGIDPFASKVLRNGKKVFTRIRGISANVGSSATIIDFTIPFSLCKITGLEIINTEIGDNATFQIIDTSTGTISGVANAVLNEFGTNVALSKNLYKYVSQYDADLIQDMKLRIVYDSFSMLTFKTVYINYFLHEVRN